MNNNYNIFSGLEDLGFKNINDVELYEKKQPENDINNKHTSDTLDVCDYIYDRTVTCPVCEHVFKAKSVKKSGYRVEKKDSDFFIHYSLVNPYFYDVWICPSCGYSAMKSDFQKIKSSQKDLIIENVTSKWTGKSYDEKYDVNIAIERYKLALLNSVLSKGRSSQKAMICLKIAWMYRLLGQSDLETTFLKKALQGFNDAYLNERFPIYKMDKYTMMYIIGELNRRVDNTDDSLLWFNNLIVTPGVKQKLKELARDQRDIIKESLSENIVPAVPETKKNSKSFFSKFF